MLQDHLVTGLPGLASVAEHGHASSSAFSLQGKASRSSASTCKRGLHSPAAQHALLIFLFAKHIRAVNHFTFLPGLIFGVY